MKIFIGMYTLWIGGETYGLCKNRKTNLYPEKRTPTDAAAVEYTDSNSTIWAWDVSMVLHPAWSYVSVDLISDMNFPWQRYVGINGI